MLLPSSSKSVYLTVSICLDAVQVSQLSFLTHLQENAGKNLIYIIKLITNS